MSFKVHMHSLGVLTHPALDVTGLGPLTAEAAQSSRRILEKPRTARSDGVLVE